MRVKIMTSTQELRFSFKGRVFRADIFGTGVGATCEIVEVDVQTGLTNGHRKSYCNKDRKLPPLRIIADRYMDDLNKEM